MAVAAAEAIWRQRRDEPEPVRPGSLDGRVTIPRDPTVPRDPAIHRPRAGRLPRSAAALALTLLAASAAAQAPAADPLDRYRVEAAAVAGASSGGAMAVQLHVAHSRTFSRGAAVIAGAPYDCAQGSVLRATTRCMRALPTAPDERASIRLTEARAASGDVDPIGSLASGRVYLFSGTRDSVVRRPVMDALHRYYRRFVPAAAILYDRDVPAPHAWISPSAERECAADGPPYINDCDIDVPGRLLTWLFGAMAPKSSADAIGGRLLQFDQREFVGESGTSDSGLDDAGWVFVPEACAAGDRCRLLVALHGCRQGRASVGDAFVRQAGLNEWADANRIVVLYPQAVATSWANPNGCWDWWGYSDERYPLKTGIQIQAIKAMVDRVFEAPPAR